jgi:Glycosyl transferase family 2
MRILGHMVTKNEMGRLLTCSLPWLCRLTDGHVAVYDDQSDDDTVTYARRELEVAVVRRPGGATPFSEDESAFRRDGWGFMERALQPEPGDWVLAVDADEFLVTTDPSHTESDVKSELESLVEALEMGEQAGVTFRVPEVFARDASGWPQIRTDGYWGNILARRLVKWRPGGAFHPRREGGGSVPSNWPCGPTPARSLALLHFGYATPEDQSERHARYSRGIGHNPVHVDSIRRPPSLTRWTGMTPAVLLP